MKKWPVKYNKEIISFDHLCSAIGFINNVGGILYLKKPEYKKIELFESGD